jgi:hypothetical protein
MFARGDSFRDIGLPAMTTFFVGGVFTLFGAVFILDSLLWLVGIVGLLGLGAWPAARKRSDQ